MGSVTQFAKKAVGSEFARRRRRPGAGLGPHYLIKDLGERRSGESSPSGIWAEPQPQSHFAQL